MTVKLLLQPPVRLFVCGLRANFDLKKKRRWTCARHSLSARFFMSIRKTQWSKGWLTCKLNLQSTSVYLKRRRGGCALAVFAKCNVLTTNASFWEHFYNFLVLKHGVRLTTFMPVHPCCLGGKTQVTTYEQRTVHSARTHFLRTEEVLRSTHNTPNARLSLTSAQRVCEACSLCTLFTSSTCMCDVKPLSFSRKITVVLQREVKVLNKSQTLFSANFRPLGLYQAKRQSKLIRLHLVYTK
jgi:hypothetical protein